jgi:hypothetical protein
MIPTSVLDKNGRSVSVGTRIKILSLTQGDFAHLTSGEFSKLAERFVGKVFEVDEIDKHGQAWVTHMEEVSGDHCNGESVALSAGEMEFQEI